MILTKLTLNLTSYAARRDISNPYQMHATFMRLVGGGGVHPLWRAERYRVGSAPVVLVQTDAVPDVGVFQDLDEDYLLDHESRPNRLLENIVVGDRLNFRVRANPTVTRAGKRHGLVRMDEQITWMQRQLEANGARPLAVVPSESRRETFWKRSGAKPITLVGATFDGALEITDLQAFRGMIMRGVGHGKSFGFGLVTVAR